MERVLFRGDTDQAPTLQKGLDELWYVPQQQKHNHDYYRILHWLEEDKVKPVPFVWDPMFIDKTEIDGLFFNGGWCYGGFKATPASGYCFAHLIATGSPHETATAYRFDRFRKGLMIDEKGVGAQPNLH